jgi:hypothetical protein
MKRLLALFLLSVATVCAQMETIDLGARGKITLFLLGDWKVDLSNLGNNPVLTIKPAKEAVNAECTISVTFPEADRFDTKARLKLRVEADNRNQAEASVEGKAIGREFSLSSGFGFYCNFTDPDLRGKAPEKGNFKNGTFGKIRLAPDVLLDVVIMADGFNSEPYQQLLGAVEGMEFKPGRGR